MTERAPRIAALLQHRHDELGDHGARPIASGELAALGLALKLKTQLGGTLTALAVGSESGQRQVLSACLGAGCDRAVSLVDSRGDDDRDPGAWLRGLECLEVARVISAALKHLGCDLVLCAERARGERQGGLGPAIAELQDMLHFTGVVDTVKDSDSDSEVDESIDTEIDVDGYPDPEEDTDIEVVPYAAALAAQRFIVTHRGGGDLHRFRGSMPAMLCVMACPLEDLPALEPVAGSIDPATTAGENAIESLSLDDLGIATESASQMVSAVAVPDQARHEGAVITSAAELVARLVDDQLLR